MDRQCVCRHPVRCERDAVDGGNLCEPCAGLRCHDSDDTPGGEVDRADAGGWQK